MPRRRGAWWKRLVDDAPSAVTVTVNKGASQDDPTTDAEIVFDVVFSEAVTGFTDADVTLSGTAGADTAVVAGSGSTYTVTVSGMTTDGTVIASIDAGVATSVATSVANDASTSTDNSVEYAVPTPPEYVSTGGPNNGGLNVARPANTTIDDLLVWVCNNANCSDLTIDGFTMLVRNGEGAVFWRIADGTEPANWNVTTVMHSANTVVNFNLVHCFRNVSLVMPFDDVTPVYGGPPHEGITTNTVAALAVFILNGNNDATVNGGPTNGFMQRMYSTTTAGVDTTYGLSDKQVDATATGETSWTLTGATARAFMLALRAA